MTESLTTLPSEALEDLRARLSGELITAGDPGYDDARLVFNASVDRRPQAIARVAGPGDVATALAFARERGLPLAVRGGRHSFNGDGVVDDGVVIDTSLLKDIEIDPESRTAVAGAGLTANEYTQAAAQYGLATGFGDAGGVGIAGITLGGGLGYLLRKHGITADDLLGAELVTADGTTLEVSDESDPELMWALRGGGGNFGVVTKLRYRLHELDRVYGGMLILPGSTQAVTEAMRIAAEAPDELTTMMSLMVAPPLPMIPEEHQGSLVLMILLAYAGDPSEGERAVKPLREIAPPAAEMLQEMPWGEIYNFAGDGPPRSAAAFRTAFVDELSEDAIETTIERIRAGTQGMAVAQFRVLGGAMARVPSDATAFAHRERKLMVVFGGMNPAGVGQPALEEWVSGTMEATGVSGAAYSNYLGSDAAERIGDAYPSGTLERLRAVKRWVDPENLFRMNVNIEP